MRQGRDRAARKTRGGSEKHELGPVQSEGALSYAVGGLEGHREPRADSPGLCRAHEKMPLWSPEPSIKGLHRGHGTRSSGWEGGEGKRKEAVR